MKEYQKLIGLIICVLIAIAAGWFVLNILTDVGLAEDGTLRPVYVIADVLNGRAHPTKKAPVEAVYDYGDQLQPTGRISRDCEWIEVLGGESGTVWVHVNYVSERFTDFEVTNLNNGKIKIRSKPTGGKLKGYVKHGKTIVIDRVVLGWGHCSKGWVDLEYFVEEDP